jgi:O-antigen/teichoic acid export membrane protein
VLGLLVYLIVLGRTDLFWIVAIFAGAEVIRTVPPLVVALRYEWARLWWERKHPSTLAQERPAILSTLWHTNLAGYLKLGADQGGGFLLGILSTPTQLAIYGIARQLTRPLVMLQVNVQTALAPEVFTAAARKGYPQLLRLTRRFTAMKTGVAVVLLAGAVVFAEPIVLLVASPDYLGAVPVFYLMCAMVALTFSTLTFYPLTVALDHMLRRNVVEAIRFVFIGAAVASGLDALKMTAAQFAGSATTLLGSDLFVYRDLKQRAERHASEAPDASDASEAPTPSERSASPHAPASPAAASSDVPSATTDLAS